MTKQQLRPGARRKASSARRRPRRKRSLFNRFKLVLSAATLVSDIVAFCWWVLAPTFHAGIAFQFAALFILTIPAAYVLAGWAQERFRSTSWFDRPDRVSRILKANSSTLGRDAVFDDLRTACVTSQVVKVIGEPGVGKSVVLGPGLRKSLTNARLALGDRQIVPVYVADLGTWNSTELATSLTALAQARPGGKGARALTKTLDVLLERWAQSDLIPLLIIDHFDRYLLTCPSERAFDSAYWRLIQSAVLADRLRLIVLSADAACLDNIQFGRSYTTTIPRLPTAVVGRLLTTLGDECVGGDQEAWKALSSALLRDLSGNGDGHILPLHAYLAISGLTTLERLDIYRYSQVGGLPGVVGRFVSRYITEAHDNPKHFDGLLTVLCSLFDSARGTLVTITDYDLRLSLRRAWTDATDAGLTRFLQSLTQHQLLRPAVHGNGERAWRLPHAFIGGALHALRDARQPVAAEFARLSRRFDDSHGVSKVFALLPPTSLLRLVSQSRRGQLSLRGHTLFLLASATKVVLLCCALALWSWWAWRNSSDFVAYMQEPIFDEVKWRFQLKDAERVDAITDALVSGRIPPSLVAGYRLRDVNYKTKYELDMYFDVNYKIAQDLQLLYWRVEASSLKGSVPLKGRWVVSTIDSAASSISSQWRRSEPKDKWTDFFIDASLPDYLDSIERQARRAAAHSPLIAGLNGRMRRMNISFEDVQRTVVLPSTRLEWTMTPLQADGDDDSRVVVLQVTRVAALCPTTQFEPLLQAPTLESFFGRPFNHSWIELEAEEQGISRLGRLIWSNDRLENRNTIEQSWGLEPFRPRDPEPLPKYLYALTYCRHN